MRRNFQQHVQQHHSELKLSHSQCQPTWIGIKLGFGVGIGFRIWNDQQLYGGNRLRLRHEQ
jgi:hypothetical protein